MFNPFKNTPLFDGSAVVITGGSVAPTTLILPEKTPVNAVAASKVLTIGTNPVESATVTIGGTSYRFRVAVGAGVKAEQTLTFNTELPHDGDTVILGSTTYTFKTALTPTAGEVLIEADVTSTIDNLVAAVDGGAGEGVKYATGTPDIGAVVTPTKPTADTFKVVYYVVGTLGNGFDTLGTLTHATWGGATLLGGVNPEAANDVLIGADVSESIDNLVLAIMAGTGAGTLYGTGTVVNASATAAKTTAATMTATNKVKGVIGNSTAVAEGLADGSWAGGATFLTGGTDGTVGEANETCSDADYIYHTPVANTIADANWQKVSLLDDDILSTVQVFHGVQSIGTVSFSNTTKALSVVGITVYWYKGVKVTMTTTTCDLDLTADRDHASATLTANTLYYFYFKDATGKLYWSPVAWDMKETVPVATVFWNGSAGATHKEWHNHTRDLDWHTVHHHTVGARYYSGLSLTKPTTAFDANLDLTTGYLYDEDLLITITNPTTARAWYQASAGVYTFADISRPFTGAAANDCSYLDTDTYLLTTATASKFVCYWVYASGDIDRPIYIIPTHAADPYNTIALARAETVPSLSGLGLNPELKLIYRWIYRGDGEFQEAADYRLSSSLPIGAVPTPAASSVSFAPTGTLAATNVQAAIEELLAEGGSSSNTYHGAIFDGGGAPILADTKAYVRLPRTGTIVGAYALANVSGSITIAVWKDTYANFPPTVADVISAAAPITITTAQKVEDLTLTGWTTEVTAGDVICLNVNALATTITWVSAGIILQ